MSNTILWKQRSAETKTTEKVCGLRESKTCSLVCSDDFKDEHYSNRFAGLTDNSDKPLEQRLKRDRMEVCVFPTKHARPF